MVRSKLITWQGQSFQVTFLGCYGHFRVYFDGKACRDDSTWQEVRRTVKAWADYCNGKM